MKRGYDEGGAAFEPLDGDRQEHDNEGDKVFLIDQPVRPKQRKSAKATKRAKPAAEPERGCALFLLVCAGSLAALLVAVVLVAALWMLARTRAQAAPPVGQVPGLAMVIKLP